MNKQLLLEDSFKSENINCIKYALNVINKTIYECKNEILNYSYHHHLKDIIYLLDESNNHLFDIYNDILLSCIYYYELNNDSDIIIKILNKKDISIHNLSYSIIKSYKIK